MKFYRSPLVCALAVSFCLAGASAENTQPLKFEEVYNLVRTNLLHLNEQELSQMAAKGLLEQLGTLAEVGSRTETTEPTAEAVTRQAVYSDAYGYIRVGQVTSSLPREIKAAFETLASTNRLKGLVLDLRYSAGNAYLAAAQTADLFLAREEVLLKLGGKELRSTAKKPAISVPAAILVNERTRGAAEALAAMLRDAEIGLIIGSQTAGEARLYQEFKLSTGQELRLASIPVSLPDGTPLPDEGLQPDIAVTVQPAAEQIFYSDPFASLSRVFPGLQETNVVANATNRVRPMNEAELVRRHREGIMPDATIAIDPSAELFEDESVQPVVTDPVLARGLDFLKGISVLQQFRQ